jgi:hypothetical protein
MFLKSLLNKLVPKPSETQINVKLEVYVIYENGRLLGLSTDLAAISALQSARPNADLLVVEIDDTVWNSLEKQTEETMNELR